VHGDALQPLSIDLVGTAPGLLVLGPRGSGRTGTLRTVLEQLTDGAPGRPPVVVVSGREAPPPGPVGPTVAGRLSGPDAVAGLTALLASVGTRCAVLVDDAERLLDGAAATALDTLVATAHDTGHLVVIAAATADLATTSRAWVTRLKRGRNVLLLRPPGRSELMTMMLPAPPRTPEPLPQPGRGLLYLDGDPTRVQVAEVGG
jgi:hypothetical protein